MADAQLTLPLASPDPYRAEDFLPAASNAAARQWLAHPETWPRGRLILWGPPGCGKTHLARVWKKARGSTPGPRLGAAPPDPHTREDTPTAVGVSSSVCGSGGAAVRRGCGGETPDLPSRLAVDDAAAMEEPALFHLINACESDGTLLLLTSAAPPPRWAARLPDLASRLAATQTVEIAAPEDALLRTLLARLLAERQLQVGLEVQAWLLTRLPRTASAIGQAVVLLDAASLARQRPITRALARETLAGLLTDEEA